MDTLRTLLAGLGGAGAVRNAEAALLVRQTEDQVIAELVGHLAERDHRHPLEPAA